MKAALPMVSHLPAGGPADPPAHEAAGDAPPEPCGEEPVSLDPEFLAWLEELL